MLAGAKSLQPLKNPEPRGTSHGLNKSPMLSDATRIGACQMTLQSERNPFSPPLLTPHHALFLDFDGTLVELADHPDSIVVPSALPALLLALDDWLGGAIAIVTGRRLESLDAHLDPLRLRGSGIHGAQLRRDRDFPATEPPVLENIAERLLARFAGDPAIVIENKGAAVAVHYRNAPERGNEVREALFRCIGGDGLEVIAGKCVFEVRRGGQGKDAAIRELMRGAPFLDRLPVFVGDDLTDEDGIREVQARGGVGIKVGEDATAARWRLANPSAVREWLTRSMASLPET